MKLTPVKPIDFSAIYKGPITPFITSPGAHLVPGKLTNRLFQAILVVGFPLHKPLRSRIHTAYIGEYLHFRYLKCLVIPGTIQNGVFFPMLMLVYRN